MTEPIELHAERARQPTTALAIMVVAFVLFQAAYFGVSWIRDDHARDRADCVAQLQGHLTASGLRALAAPPVAPGATPAEVARTTRGKSISDGLATANKIDHPDRYC